MPIVLGLKAALILHRSRVFTTQGNRYLYRRLMLKQLAKKEAKKSAVKYAGMQIAGIWMEGVILDNVAAPRSGGFIYTRAEGGQLVTKELHNLRTKPFQTVWDKVVNPKKALREYAGLVLAQRFSPTGLPKKIIQDVGHATIIPFTKKRLLPHHSKRARAVNFTIGLLL